MKRIFFVVLLAMFSSCVHQEYETPQTPSPYIVPLGQINAKRISLAELTQKASAEITLYPDDEVFEGVVISSDYGGNFYKKMYIQALDKSGSVALVVDRKNLFVHYPIGSVVALRLKGTTFWLNSRYSIVEVGYGHGQTATGNAKMGYLPPSMLQKVVFKTGEIRPIDSIATQVHSLKELNKGKNFNKLLLLKNVSFEAKAIGQSYHQKNNPYNTSYNLLSGGGTLAFHTSSFAAHANEKVPEGNLQILGILTKYGTGYQFSISSEKDIQQHKP